jgi:pimeloyl-ACP methyl ester carboxylesterase
MRRRHYIFVPGILQNPETVDSWADLAIAHVTKATPDTAVCYEYNAGPITRTWFGGQKRHAKCVEDLCRRYSYKDVVLVGHSNGCDLITRVLRDNPDVTVDAVHLFAAATDADFVDNGLNRALVSGQIARGLWLYCSPNDRALRIARDTNPLLKWLGWAYGYLGLVGPVRPSLQALATNRGHVKWELEFDHSTWFEANHFDETMGLITQ